MKVLAGSIAPDAGEVVIGGKLISLRSPLDAIRAGIAAVYQELALCPHLTVAENIFLGREPGGAFFIDKNSMRERAAGLLERLGAHCTPDDFVSKLGTAQMQF